MLIAFDQNHLNREVFYPHIGQKKHSLGHPFRMGVWVDSNFRWLDDGGWSRNLLNQDQTIIANVELIHPDLDIEINASEAVDFHENLFLRRFKFRIPSW
jgi:GH15 family glucan-1,4-alpha-glucosidase